MKKKLIAGVAATALLAAAANGATVFGVDANNNLVTFDSAAPGSTISSRAIGGVAGRILALDFRDSNGLLYGLGSDLRLYTIDTATGVASAIGGPLAISGTQFGFDFNTAIDALRVVSNTDANYVVNPNTGAVTTTATPVAFGAGDRNAGVDPTVTANAYIHRTATQYAIDTNSDFLVTQANNSGTLGSVGPLGFNFGPDTSFDIDFDGVGYVQDGTGFYTVNLTTGAATLVGNTAAPLFGIAVQGVPEPGTWAMLILGFGAIGSAMRRRPARVRVAYS